jgi:riboflavin synthase
LFTGIITHLGVVAKKTQGRLVFKVPIDLYQRLSLGASVAVNGICLTVTELNQPDFFSVDFMPETAKKTNLDFLKISDEVNLELPVTPETLLAGHLVQGHVDGVSQITEIKSEGNSYLVTLSLAANLSKYLVNKGSITVNGISLTVIEAQATQFTVGIIPHTWEKTMLHGVKTGDFVNLEVDVLAKYVEKLLVYQK